ncbi:MAG: hypothetical protein JWO53_815 [Chlamydiia bacterium]|nr:hypothetical protein [Chlamydiia bacterium]
MCLRSVSSPPIHIFTVNQRSPLDSITDFLKVAFRITAVAVGILSGYGYLSTGNELALGVCLLSFAAATGLSGISYLLASSYRPYRTQTVYHQNYYQPVPVYHTSSPVYTQIPPAAATRPPAYAPGSRPPVGRRQTPPPLPNELHQRPVVGSGKNR